jgi:hypothetical protein
VSLLVGGMMRHFGLCFHRRAALRARGGDRGRSLSLNVSDAGVGRFLPAR